VGWMLKHPPLYDERWAFIIVGWMLKHPPLYDERWAHMMSAVLAYSNPCSDIF